MLLKNWLDSPQPGSTQQPIGRRLYCNFTNAFKRIQLAIEIKRERKALVGLTEKELLDIGILRADADMESRRSIFDVPANRL